MALQIPNLFISNRSAIEGKATVEILRRKDAVHAGMFAVRANLSFDPSVDPYPVGSLDIKVDLTDSVKGTVIAKTVEEINSMGKHTPTLFATGRCDFRPAEHAEVLPGCRYWIVFADNRRADEGTPDVIGFLVYDRNGKRIAYGTGPVKTGDVTVKPSSD